MPQPIRKKCHLEITGLANRPQHAIAVGHLIGVSGHLEAMLGWLMALFSGGSAAITVSMFHAVTSTDAQRAMLLAAAEKSLGSTELDAFNDLMEDFRPRYRERNKLVHNLWGHSNDHPDKAIWCKASDASSFLVQIASAEMPLPHVPDMGDLSLKCMSYSVEDIGHVVMRLEEFRRRVAAFAQQLIENHPVLAAVATASTNAPPIGEESQLDLRQPDQIAHQSGPPTEPPPSDPIG